MAELMDKQLQLKYSLDRALDNFKKLDRSNLTPEKVTLRISRLKELWDKFVDGHCALMRAVPEASRKGVDYFRDGMKEQAEESFEQALDHMEDALVELARVVSPTSAGAPALNRSFALPSHTVQLPAIPLPPFDGNPRDWEAFRDKFHALIISDPQLTNVARMHYLGSCLSGPAHDCIKSLPITADSFEIAWKTLVSRFEDRRRLLNQHLATHVNLPSLPHESASGLQALQDRVSIAIASLNGLQRSPSDLWHDMLIFLVVNKLDSATCKAWNMRISENTDFLSFDALSGFLATRTRGLAAVPKGPVIKPSTKTPVRHTHVATAAEPRSRDCDICKGHHPFSACPTFKRGNPTQRRALVRKHDRCFNCLSRSHALSACTSKYTCRVCQGRHHSLLHETADSVVAEPIVESITSCSPLAADTVVGVGALHASSGPQSRHQMLLSTALVQVHAPSGKAVTVRALLDSGSQVSLLTDKVARLLHLRRIRLPVTISAVGGASAVPKGTPLYRASVTISPLNALVPSYSVDAVIMSTLTDYAPTRVPTLATYSHLSKLSLADPNPTSSDPVDIILGADIYNSVLRDGRRTGHPSEPTAQNSIFGWVLSGPALVNSARNSEGTFDAGDSDRVSTHHCTLSASLDVALRRFWEVEELPPKPILSAVDEQCEAHFIATHSRTADGRYVVRLPFRSGPPLEIGESRNRADRLLGALRRRLHANSDHAREYDEFLREYEQLGHMRRVPSPRSSVGQVVYIPHHAVIREANTTTHLRVVFNASALTTNGTSLNDHLHCGAKLQADLPTVITKWRLHRYVYLADIAKMYRQILVDPRDIDFQRILWQPAGMANPVEYQLLTVTYGTACAPFLALRVIKQLVVNDGAQFPVASPILRDNIYVDDVLFGHHNREQLRRSRDELVALLGRAGFELRKWASNDPQLLEDIDDANHGLACSRSLENDDNLKVLGIRWSPAHDSFQVAVSLADRPPQTKRSILSAIARIYDPLGWITPTTIAAKTFMQTLWAAGVGWDVDLPSGLLSRWNALYYSFSKLSHVQIPRWIGLGDDVQLAELHGFSDASTIAYAAVVYLRVLTRAGGVSVSLVAGKSRVAPLRPLTVPRLELSGAVLLARLMRFVRESLAIDLAACYCWTDSAVVLAWLRQHPSRWRVFVSNRVSEIQTGLPDAHWRHVPTLENPADCASCGLLGPELLDHSLWWHGPCWLSRDPWDWPEQSASQTADEPLEERAAACVNHIAQQDADFELISRYSSWLRLLRVTAYILRFLRRCRRRPDASVANSITGRALTSAEITGARITLITLVQQALFPTELHNLRQGKPIAARSSILDLQPFLDKDCILRVGGRIRKAPLPFSIRHPILLASHPLANLIIEHAHLRTLHAGLQLTLSTVRREYWIVRARSVVRAAIRRCVACTRERAAVPTQLMGDLPAVRITAPIRAFLHCGLDYAGPVQVRPSSVRGGASRKAYLALFICLATRAIHLELVADCSTSAFRGAFTRFCARRGVPQTVYSDNGTTFVGAEREIARAYRDALRDPDFLNSTATDRITWHFIPPVAPHFGGLWEAGVKSVKHHVRRVVGRHRLKFEELTTLLCAIEACLNSRPIAPLTDSIEDFDPLTPGHFLIGTALTSVPEPSVLHLAENRLNRWQLVCHTTETFWKIWTTDYINTLQQRTKWGVSRTSFKIGQLVLLRNPGLPPCKWELGRIIACHPGADGLTRVVTVKTAASEFKRPISKLCLLPVDLAPETAKL